jgi:type 1 glutamine amidotransferase
MVDILVLCDSPWHPSEVVQMGLAFLESNDCRLSFVKAAKDILTPARIAEYPLIICCKSDNVSEVNAAPWFEEGVTEVGPKELELYVRAGGGFLAIHASTLGKEGSQYSRFIGNTYLGHPPRCNVEVIITSEHPIVSGVSDFHIRDEHYQIDIHDKGCTELFRTFSPTGGGQVGGYCWELGNGRLCALTPGHCYDVFCHPEYRKILLSAIRWCLKIWP